MDRSTGLAHSSAERASDGAPSRRSEPPLVVLVGNPNVGKSVMFGALTGHYATVSNYPGTTVEVTQGNAELGARRFRVVDTPGMYSLLPITEEERVARGVVMEQQPFAVVHVVDTKSLGRTLPLTVQLTELGQSVVLVLNMMDEAKRLGIRVDTDGLQRELGIPVIGATMTRREGLGETTAAIARAGETDRPKIPVLRYSAHIERAVAEIKPRIPARFAGAERGIALLLLQEDAWVRNELGGEDPEAAEAIDAIVQRTRAISSVPLFYQIALERQTACTALVGRHADFSARERADLGRRLSELTIAPITGLPILALIVYFGLYRFVGTFAAGDVVNFLERKCFGEYLNPWLNARLGHWLPGSSGWQYWTRELFGGQYGLVTLGATYAMAIVLPIVSLFFLFFAILEDSGYFPRLALLLDRAFKAIGLNGRAVVPVVLGFGCDTMATMVTRIQETKRERAITTLLLALAIPCSAQYGLITGLLSRRPAGALGISYAWLAWAGVVFAMFLLTGRLASRLLPGKAPSFYMELPPLRWPRIGNVLVKTLARMKWYFLEILPLFLVASVLIWIGRITGGFDAIIGLIRPLVGAIGLPASTAPAILYGFFRRDFGAAGLYDLADSGGLSGRQLLVVCVTLTLFLPCVAQLLIMLKERGWKSALAMAAGIVAVAFVVGGLVNALVLALGVAL